MSETSPLLSPTSPPGSPSRHATVADTDDVTDQHVSLARGCAIAVAILTLLLTLTFGISILTTVQSSIARDLDVTSGVSWFVSAYLIASTSVLPVAGRLCQIFSPRSYLLISTVVQAVGLVITASAPTFGLFTLGRVVCGAGAAAATPVALLLVITLATRKRWGLLFGLINSGYTVGLALGAVAGGGLEPLIGWRALFWVQAPICLAAGLLAYFVIPSKSSAETTNSHDDLTSWQKMARIDYLGIMTLIATVVLVLYTLASPKFHPAPIILAAFSFALFCLVEIKWATEPIVPLAVMTSRPMLLSSIATLGLMSARWETLFYTPTYAIAVRGWTQAQAGLLLVPTNVGFGTGSLIVGYLHINRSGSFYISCIVYFMCFALDHLALSQMMTPDSPAWLFVLAIFINGWLAGALLNYNLTHLLFLMDPSYHAIAMPITSMFRSLSGSIGSALAGGLFIRTLQRALSDGFESRGVHGKDQLVSQLLSRPLLVQKLAGVDLEVAIAGYSISLQYLFAIGSLLAVFMLFCQAGTGWTASSLKNTRGVSKNEEVEEQQSIEEVESPISQQPR